MTTDVRSAVTGPTSNGFMWKHTEVPCNR